MEEVKTSLSKEEADAKYLELKSNFVEPENDELLLPPPTATDKVTNFLSLFKPTNGYFITPILININLFVFIAMIVGGADIISPNSEVLLDWGANFRPMTLDGEWWRLITCCFLHIGVIHLLLNLFALMYIGVLLEPLLGRSRFAWAYFITGIFSSVVSLWWHDLTISAGASGAIFGMYGVFLALLTTNLIEKSARQSLLASIGIFVGYNLIYGLKGGVDNAAHIGGLISGFAFGYAVIPALKHPDEKRLSYLAVGGMTVITIAVTAVIYFNTNNDVAEYNKRREEFSKMEVKALRVFSLPQESDRDQILDAIKPTGINDWKECIKIMETCKTLDLAPEFKNEVKVLIEYCEIRIESYETLYKAISQDTEIYGPEIEANNKLIQEKMKELGTEPK